MSILSDEFYYQHINLDTVNTQVFTNLTSKVGDTNGRGLIVTLTENGLQKDTTGISLNLKWKHRSVVSQGLDNFDVVDLSKGVYKITYPTEMNRSGLVDAFVQIVDGTKIVGTRNMIISVESTVGDDSAIESSNSFTALASALIEVQSWNDRIDVVEQEFIDKANNLDATYPTRLLSAEQQLEQAEAQIDLLNRGLGETFATLTALQTAYPTGDTKDHIVAADGHRYYWNDTAWADGGAYQAIEIADASVSVKSTNFIAPGKNLFNKATITANYYISPTNGTLVSAVTADASDFIELKPNTTSVKNVKGHVAFYDSSQNFIGGINETVAIPGYVITTPSNTKYIRFSIKKSEGYSVETTQLELGNTVTAYEPYTVYKVDYAAVPLTQIFDGAEYKTALVTTTAKEKSAKTKLLLDDFRLASIGDVSTLTAGSTVTRTPHSVMDFFTGLNELRIQFTSTETNQGLKIKLNSYDVSANGHAIGDFIQYGFLINADPSTFNYCDLSLSYNSASRNILDLGNGWSFVYGNHQITQADLTNLLKINEIRILSKAATTYDFRVLCPVIMVNTKLVDLFSVVANSIMPNKPKYNNKKWNSLGDSITAAYAYQYKVQQKLGFSIIKNYGISGTTLADNGSANPMVNRYMTMDVDADVITVLGGTNDFGQAVPLGDNTTYDKATFKGALRTLIEGLIGMYKTKKIVFMTPPPRYHVYQQANNWLNGLNLSVRDYADAIITICADYGIPVVDLNRNCGINQLNQDVLLADTVHPSDLGYTRISELLSDKLNGI